VVAQLQNRFAAAGRNRPLMVGLFLEAPLIFIGWYAWLLATQLHWRITDFIAMRNGGIALLHGASPYATPDPSALFPADHLIYPPLVGYVFTPFSLLPYAIGAPLYVVLQIAALAGALALLGVRDWRCYGMLFLWYPVIACLISGALGPFLAFLLALAWRYRDRAFVVAPALALAVVAKLFLWPLGIWLLATRRWRAALLAGVATVVAFIVPFAPLGLETLRGYPHLLRLLDQVFGPSSFSISTLARTLGASATVGHAVTLLVGIGLFLAALALGLRHRSERSVLTVTLLAALLTSPIVWMHYYVLLIVPIALARPRLSGLWFVPLLYWASPATESVGDLRRLIVGIGVTVAVAAATTLRLKSRVARASIASGGANTAAASQSAT
jgi:alpha-1,2-mannosyltransferase